MPFELGLLRAIGRVPQLHELVAAAGGECGPITRKGHGSHRARMGGHRLHLGPGGRVPEDDRAILTGRREPRAVGREGERPHPALVLLEIVLERAGLKIPELHEAVVAGRGCQFAVGRQLHRPHGSGMAGKVAHTAAVGNLPHDDVTGAIEQTLAAGGDEQAAVTGVVRRDHPPLEIGQFGCRGRLRGRRIGGLHGPGHTCHHHESHGPAAPCRRLHRDPPRLGREPGYQPVAFATACMAAAIRARV